MTLQMFGSALRMLITTAALFAASAALADIKSYTIKAPDGVELAVQESGDPKGAPIVFIHGLLGSRLSWDAQLQSPQLQRYRMITFDLRGHGLSGKPTDVASYREGKRWADDLATVIESSRARNPVLVGWSLGGVVISNYLAEYGDSRIGGAVYVAGVIELKPEQLVAHPEVYRDLNSPELSTHIDAVRTFLRLCFHTQPETATFERLLANAALASWTMQSTVPSMSVAAAEGLSKAKVPVLLIYGARDALVQAKPSMARALELNSHVRSTLYPESGHAPFVEERDRFNRDLSAFVESISRR